MDVSVKDVGLTSSQVLRWEQACVEGQPREGERNGQVGGHPGPLHTHAFAPIILKTTMNTGQNVSSWGFPTLFSNNTPATNSGS